MKKYEVSLFKKLQLPFVTSRTLWECDLQVCSTVSVTDAGWTWGRSIAVQVYSPECEVSAFVIISRPSRSTACWGKPWQTDPVMQTGTRKRNFGNPAEKRPRFYTPMELHVVFHMWNFPWKVHGIQCRILHKIFMEFERIPWKFHGSSTKLSGIPWKFHGIFTRNPIP